MNNKRKKSLSKFELLKIYNEGREAFKSQKHSLDFCPYKPDGTKELVWILGYQFEKIFSSFNNQTNERAKDEEIFEDVNSFFLNFGWFEQKERLTEAIYKNRKVALNKPMRGDRKRYKVYVDSGKRTKSGEIIAKKVEFGSLKGDRLRVRNFDKKRAKSFAARHKCHTAKDPKTPRYWSCRAPLAKSRRIW